MSSIDPNHIDSLIETIVNKRLDEIVLRWKRVLSFIGVTSILVAAAGLWFGVQSIARAVAIRTLDRDKQIRQQWTTENEEMRKETAEEFKRVVAVAEELGRNRTKIEAQVEELIALDGRVKSVSNDISRVEDSDVVRIATLIKELDQNTTAKTVLQSFGSLKTIENRLSAFERQFEIRDGKINLKGVISSNVKIEGTLQVSGVQNTVTIDNRGVKVAGNGAPHTWVTLRVVGNTARVNCKSGASQGVYLTASGDLRSSVEFDGDREKSVQIYSVKGDHDIQLRRKSVKTN